MAETRIPIDFKDDSLDRETRDPIEWEKGDDDRWEEGWVLCPTAAASSDVGQCLRQKEVDAIEGGMILVWEVEVGLD